MSHLLTGIAQFLRFNLIDLLLVDNELGVIWFKLSGHIKVFRSFLIPLQCFISKCPPKICIGIIWLLFYHFV
jgi:hypothetical protein